MQRNNTIDIARGIGMLGIMMLHMQLVITYPWGASAVPLFFVISGYLMKPIANKRSYTKNRLKRLLIPYGFTSLMMLLCAIFSNSIFPSDRSNGTVILEWIYAAVYGAGDPYTEPFYIKSIGGIWFLLATLWAALFMQWIIDRKWGWQIICVSVLFLTGVATSALFWFPFSIQAGMCSTVYMYIGYLAKEGLPWLQKQSKAVKGGFLLISITACVAFYRFFEAFWLVHCEFAHGIFDIIGSLGAVVCYLMISAVLSRHCNLLGKALAVIGKYSIVILCVHIIELEAFPWGEVVNALIAHGVSEYMASAVWLRVFKIVWIAAATVFCIYCPITRKIFGIKKAR